MKRSPKLSNSQCNEIINARSDAEGSKWDTKIHPGSGLNYYDLRYKVGVAVVEDGYTVTHACRKFVVSRNFVFKWSRVYLARKKKNERSRSKKNTVRMTVFKSRTNRPKCVRSPVQDKIAGAVIERRNMYPFEGSFRIKAATGVSASPTTINKVLRRYELLDVPKPRHIGKTYGCFQRPWILGMVQTDYKTRAPGVKSIWIVDDCSRMILAHCFVSNSSAEVAVYLLSEVIGMYGIPKQILTGRGTEFYSVTSGKGTSALDKFCEEVGIEHIMGRVRHPETQGKIERTRRSAAEEMSVFGNIGTLGEAEKTIGRWIQYYNWERPHQALNYITPGEAFMSMYGADIEELSVF